MSHAIGGQIGFDHDEIFKDTIIKASRFESVDRTETKGLRWRYYYESARAAYERLEFDGDKFKEQQSRRGDRTGERASAPPESNASSDTSSQSKTPPEDYALTPSDEMEDVEESEKEKEIYVSVNDGDAEMDVEMEGLEIQSDIG